MDKFNFGLLATTRKVTAPGDSKGQEITAPYLVKVQHLGQILETWSYAKQREHRGIGTDTTKGATYKCIRLHYTVATPLREMDWCMQKP